MAIEMKKYVDIKSGISNIQTATEKNMIARIFTQSDAIGYDEVVECENLDDVVSIFGASGDEYKVASKYFNFINKYARNPQKISFARDFSEGIYASVSNSVQLTNADVESINAIMYAASTRTLTVTINGVSTDVTVTAYGAPPPETIDAQGTSCVFTINSALTTAEIPLECSYSAGIYTFTATTKAKQTITLSGNVAECLKVSASYNPKTVAGIGVSTYSEVFKLSYQTSNNFATFAFLATLPTADIATLAQYVSVNYPTEFMFIVPVTSANYTTIQTAVAAYDGVSLELCGETEETGKYNYFMPMAITATTDYNKENGTVTYMFVQSPDMVIVVDNDDYKNYDSAKVNYYGQTQKSGQKLAFYQNGVLQGKYQDQNIFANEIWLKDALTTVFINFMLVRSAWFYNNAGRGLGQAIIMDIIIRAKNNGTITTEKELTENDKNYIYNQTSDENAWRQIYQEGYYLTTWLESKKVNNQDTKYFCYKLIYSKGDMIKAVAGTNILI